MGFKAKNFIFNEIPSENYGIVISSTGSGDVTSTPLSDVDLSVQKLYRRSKTFLYGVSPSPVLQIPIEFNSITGELTQTDLGLIGTWLFGQQNYKKLQIIQDDMTDVYFNCFIKNPEVLKYANIVGGVKGVIVCDSPYAYSFPRISEFTYEYPPTNELITFDNLSQDSYYLSPIVEFAMLNVPNGDFSIANQTDGTIFSFENLSPNERITVDNDLQIVKSSLGLRRLSNFNKNFLRFLPGRNILRVTGDISSVKFTYSFSRKFG